MQTIQLRNEHGEPSVNVEVPEDGPMTREEVEEISLAFAQILDIAGFDISVGSTGGVDLEWYAGVDKADSMGGQYNVNISLQP